VVQRYQGTLDKVGQSAAAVDHLQKFRTSPEFRDVSSHIKLFVDQIEGMQHYSVALMS
jgi:hypothetical protein